ncbi:MAG: tetratricopeptide repeat protein, partial [Thermoanaerobaculia bacterium]|nr:tetratricopeptide repeat protein [Thermoanaerobaculia bacterium]
ITPTSGGAGAGPEVYRVPWRVLTGVERAPGEIALYWFPVSEESALSSDLMASRKLTLWSGQCVGMGLVPADNAEIRQRFGAGTPEMVILLTNEGGEIARIVASDGPLELGAIEDLLENEMQARRRIVDETLDAAKSARKRDDEAGAIALYLQAFGQRCLFPGAGKKAAKELKKLGRPVPNDVTWRFGDDGPDLVEPDLGDRVGERILRSIERGLQAESELKIDEARRYYQSAREADRGDAVPLRYLGELHRHHTGDWEAATSIFEEILSMPADPVSRAVAYQGLGKMALNAGEFDRGLEGLEESVRTYPLPLAYRNLAVYWNSEGEVEKAWAYTEKALELAPEDPYNQVFAATYFVDQGRGAEALRLAQRYGGMLEASYNLAAIYARLGDSEKAMSLLSRHFEEYEQYDSVRAREMKEAREDVIFADFHDDPEFRRITSLAASN